jgi:hypothetical protein
VGNEKAGFRPREAAGPGKLAIVRIPCRIQDDRTYSPGIETKNTYRSSRRCSQTARRLGAHAGDHLRRPFGTWHNRSIFKILLDNKMELDQAGATLKDIRKKVKHGSQLHDKKEKKMRNDSFQRVARKLIKERLQPFDSVERIRRLIKRWKLKDPPGRVAQRIANNMMVVQRICRPCAAGMFFRTLWNGWPTSARMRSMQGAATTGGCLLGCQNGEDRIEHYLVCEQMWQELQKIPPQGIGLSTARRTRESMLLAERGLDTADIAKIANACYAIARTVHCVRTHGRVKNVAHILRMFL